jgi:hypothetical protein
MKAAIAVVSLAAVLFAGACNDVGKCPAVSEITPGAPCTGDNLECPFLLQTESLACDGTPVEGGLATSCVCTSGSWSCPSPISCEAGGGDDAAQESDGPGGG